MNSSEEIINKAARTDLFIDDEMLISKRIGVKLINAYLENNIWIDFQYCIVDPDTKNLAIMRCYEKLNFRGYGDIATKDALGKPTTLRLMMLKRKKSNAKSMKRSPSQ